MITQRVRLGDLCDFQAGSAFPQDEQGGASGIPFIKVSDLASGANSKPLTTANNYITERQRIDLRVKLVRPGSVVFAKIGEGLKAERFRVTIQETALDNNLMAAIPRPDRCDPGFLYYLMSSLSIARLAHGSALPYLRQSDLQAVVCDVPALETQRSIAEVLGALDDKIAANDQVSRQADLLAAALTERRLLLLRPIEELAEVVMGTSPKGETLNESGDGVEFFQGVRDFGMRVPSSRVFTTAPIKMAGRGDLLISVRAPVGTINRADRDICVGRGLAAARTRTPNVLFHALRRASTWQAFNGEGTVFGSINQKDLRRTPIPWAEDEVITALEQTLEPIEQRIDQAQAESRHLATLRDTLLPHLMSGRITVRDAEKQAEEVL